ncbi:unnamed protein product [Rhizophagus irregularis]|uniref:Protein far1-related sequence 5-like n=1 Tax=Rhizophagus irregularis TaxID=588596 RepID=A0A915Z6T9_9GLOM|nr:unnamed protein product [Rhizophagus irregularis]
MEEMIQNTAEFESLLAYDSSEDFSDTESTFEDICSEMEGTKENEEDNSLELYVGKTFQNWDHVEKFMKKYAAAKGHGVRIGGGGKVDKTTNEVMKRRYLCRHAGKASSKQTTQSNVTSCRVECSWKVNIWAKKKKGCLEVTTFNDHHVGHECHPLASKFVPTLRKLPEEILEEIRFLTIFAKVNAIVQYRIIREKFKIRIYRPDLYNAIRSFRREATPGEEDTGLLLKRLYDKKTEDPRWVISMKVDPVTSSLTHLFWMSPEQQILQNLPKQLKGKLGSNFNDFMKDFYTARNSLKEDQFNERWNALLQNYPQSKDYLTKVLGCNPQSWARSFTNKYFTAGVQTTSRNEGENSTLKRLFENSNLSLCELFDALEERYQEENDYCEFVNWKQTVLQIGSQNIPKSIFGPVVKQLNEFLMPNIIKKQEEQMNLSLCYHATEIEFENARSKENVLDESNRCIDNLFDFPQVHLSSFLEDTLTILEVWEIVYLANSKTSHFIYLLNDNTFLYPLQGIDISNNEFVVISLNASASKKHSLPSQFLQQSSRQIEEIGTRSNDNSDEISRVISKKRKFGELYGLGRKLVVDVIEEGDEDIYNEVLEFFRSTRQKISQRILVSGSDGNSNIQNEINNIIEIRNPVMRRPKGRPKSKRTTSMLEESNTKTQYKCKLCKQIGHNSKTCKGKENQEV